MADVGSFDVLIVGAGPAGCVLANRLSVDPARRVLLLEAGPDYGPSPGDWPDDLRDPTTIWPDSHPWGFLHAGRPDDRPLPLARAKVVGGSSTINACFWLRGSAADYDGWADLGNPGWSFTGLLPYFRLSESDELGGPLHGGDGPVPIYRPTDHALNPVDRAFVSAVEARGFPRIADFNGDAAQHPGVGPLPKNVASGVRMNAAFTYLAPARERPNLSIVADALVDRVLLEGGHVAGVRLADGRAFHAPAVVLSAGSFGSPAVLLRSGIGPGAHLRDLGIAVTVDLPGVGQNLLDHPFLSNAHTGTRWPLRPEADPEVGSFVPVLVKACSRRTAEEIDLHLYPGQRFDAERGRWEVAVSVSLMDARSRGSVRLASPDPAAAPVIDHAYFADGGDLDALCDGVALMLDVVQTQPLAGMLVPGDGFAPPWRDRDGMRAWARESASTTWHPSGTCRMGPADDPDAVVDHAGRVRGVAGLRVVDASIFPSVVRANLHCTVVAAAEKLAGAILAGDAPP